MKAFIDETDGQLDFYNRFLIRVNNELTLEDILSDNNDGVLNGNIIEFKLNINDVNSVLFQSIKYLSAMRIKGKSIPFNIVLISLNTEKAYIYDSLNYIAEIERIYVGGASKQNSGFQSKFSPVILNYDNQVDAEKLVSILKQKKYTKINIDENCILGWATRYYQENPTANKSAFIGEDNSKSTKIGEIRYPVHFKDYIHPYLQPSNNKFRYLMDKLNDDRLKKDLGAYYTPTEYVNFSTKLLHEAIKRVPEGNDYIILDRCAGTGNLEQFLTDEELSHCIVSTYEYYEYKVLMELIGSKVRHVIHPVETANTFQNGKVLGADALSQDYIENPIIKTYIDNPNCTIIMLENPPYSEINGNTRGKDSSAVWKNSYAVKEMSSFISKNKNIPGNSTNDLANVFIWSAFNYYLRQDTDSYILYSPIKYWKAQHLINKEFVKGYAFNRRFFHTDTDACISCILWTNKNSNITSFNLEAHNIVNKEVINEGNILIQRVYKPFSEMMKSKPTTQVKGVACDLNGLETSKTEKQIIVKAIYDKDIIGYLVANGFGFDKPRLNGGLVRCGRYDGHGSFITIQDYLYKLPLFAAAKFTDNANNWKVMSQVMKTSDGKEGYMKDVTSKHLYQWLLKVLLWTCLTNQSHMRSFRGSDGRFYRNELCLDVTNGDTLATLELKNLNLNNKEKSLLKQWSCVFAHATKTEEYKLKNDLSFGVYQIEEELNTTTEIKDKKGKKKKIYNYPELNGDLNTLRVLLNNYYMDEIAPTLYKYELLK